MELPWHCDIHCPAISNRQLLQTHAIDKWLRDFHGQDPDMVNSGPAPSWLPRTVRCDQTQQQGGSGVTCVIKTGMMVTK